MVQAGLSRDAALVAKALRQRLFIREIGDDVGGFLKGYADATREKEAQDGYQLYHTDNLAQTANVRRYIESVSIRT